jgi:hypothetical protein
MKKIIVVLSALAAMASVAEAKCTKKSLNGSWSIGAAVLGAGTGTISGGVINVTIDGAPVSLTISSFSSTKCKGTGGGTFDGTPVTMTIASEKIPGSSVSPNHLLITVSAGGDSLLLQAQRL